MESIHYVFRLTTIAHCLLHLPQHLPSIPTNHRSLPTNSPTTHQWSPKPPQPALHQLRRQRGRPLQAPPAAIPLPYLSKRGYVEQALQQGVDVTRGTLILEPHVSGELARVVRHHLFPQHGDVHPKQQRVFHQKPAVRGLDVLQREEVGEAPVRFASGELVIRFWGAAGIHVSDGAATFRHTLQQLQALNAHS